MGPTLVIVPPPSFDYPPSFRQIHEPVLVQTLVPHLVVEALDESILDPSVDVLDEGQLHASWVGPHIQDLASKLGPISYHQDLG